MLPEAGGLVVVDITDRAAVVSDLGTEQPRYNDVADAPMFAAIKDDVLAALDRGALVVHNANVDVGVLDSKLGNWQRPEVFDTLKLAHRLMPEQASYKLGALVEAFKLAEGLPGGLTPHRATYDALVTARLFVRLATGPDTRACLSKNCVATHREGATMKPRPFSSHEAHRGRSLGGHQRQERLLPVGRSRS